MTEMKGKFFTILFSVAISITGVSCNNNNDRSKDKGADTTVQNQNIRTTVITADEQSALTPELVLQRLKEGNQRFLKNDVTQRNHSALIRDASGGQYPMAVILSCMDSRVPVEDVFDCSTGDLFVCRVAGNLVNDDMLGSMEYGCHVSGAKLIIVLGHRHCGAVQSAVKDVKLGNITPLLSKIKPAVDMLNDFDGDKVYSNEKYVTQVAIQHVKNVAEERKKKSPLLKEMVESGKLKIVSAGYDLNNGEVIYFE
jgi:carbonic anhydrase